MLKDDTRVALGPNSQVALDQFAFNANTHEGTLFVSVSSAALGHELTLLRVEILARMAETLGAGVVTELRTRMG